MGTIKVAIQDLFILSVLLLLFAYYAGAVGVGKTLFQGVNQLLLTSTGRDASGQFANYPK